MLTMAILENLAQAQVFYNNLKIPSKSYGKDSLHVCLTSINCGSQTFWFFISMQMHGLVCTFVVYMQQGQVFSHQGPYYIVEKSVEICKLFSLDKWGMLFINVSAVISLLS